MSQRGPRSTGRAVQPVPASLVHGRATLSDERSRPRLTYLDNLKTVLIAGIIAAHALQGYAGFGSWTYQDVREVSISQPTEVVLAILLSFGSLFLMGVFFLVAGLLSVDSVARKGAGRFASDRLLRLGIPFVVYTIVVWPVTEYLMLSRYADPGSYWQYWRGDDPFLDNGPMWFVGVLLLFSLGYAAVARLHPDHPSQAPLRGRYLVWAAIAIGTSAFLIRTVFPIDSSQVLNLHLWQWPQVLGAFCLGVIASTHGWLRPVHERLARRSGIVTVGFALAVGSSVVGTIALGGDEAAFAGGWRIPALFAAVSEGALVVAGSIWVLAWAQRHLDGTGPLRRAMARGSYAAFMLQGPVLVAVAVALRSFDLPGDVKAFTVAAAGIAASFAVAHVLVTRTALRRVL